MVKNIPIFSFILLISLSLITFSCKKESGPPVNVEAYDYTGRTVFDFLAEREYSVALVNYWATYCSPCKKEIPELVKLSAAYKEQGLLVVGASIDNAENVSLVTKLAALLKINYPVLYGLSSFFGETEVTALPSTFILIDGEVVEVITGKAEYEVFEAAVKKYLAVSRKQGAGTKPVLPGPDGREEHRFYTLEAVFHAEKERTGYLEITLKAESEFNLSGEGYPPVRITIKENDQLVISQKEFSVTGVKASQSVQWKTEVSFKGEKVPGKIVFHVALAACLDESCILVDEDVDVEIKKGADTAP